jgi:hypothetical protein
VISEAAEKHSDQLSSLRLVVGRWQLSAVSAFPFVSGCGRVMWLSLPKFQCADLAT